MKLERRDKHHAQLLLHHVPTRKMWALEGNGFSAVAAGGSMKIVLMTRMLRRTVEGYVLCVNSCIRLFRA